MFCMCISVIGVLSVEGVFGALSALNAHGVLSALGVLGVVGALGRMLPVYILHQKSATTLSYPVNQMAHRWLPN